MATRPYRVLLADDSAVLRRILAEVLARDAELEVVGKARHGGEALELFKSLSPDVVLLDVEMPVMNGIEAVRAIRAVDRTVPILMFSALTLRGAEATLDALSAGASDCVPKPSNVGHLQDALDYVSRELTSKLKQWGQRRINSRTPAAVKPVALHSSAPVPVRRASSGRMVEVVAIGVSTGGPDALAEIFRSIPDGFPTPILIVQHMPPVFTQLLAERLNKISPLTIREGVQGAVIQPGEVWIAPGNFHMHVAVNGAGRVLQLDQGPPENSCRPAVDVLFRSVAKVYGGRCLGVVLTGMGNDGMIGSRAIVNAGGRVLAQDEPTCTVWGMPRAVTDAGLAEKVIPLQHVAGEIVAATARPRVQQLVST